jgi:glycosyltransferase involved in cell wall biosynthesis
MHILQIIQCTNLGGMEHSVLTLTTSLTARGNQCRWVSLNPLGGLKTLLDRAQVPCLGLPYRGPWGALSVPVMRRAFQAEPHDSVIMSGPNFSAMLALGPPHGEPRVLTVHFHHTGVKPDWQWRAIYWLAMRRFQAITFPSDFVRREAEQIYPPLVAVSRTNRAPVKLPPLPSLGERLAARERLGVAHDVPVIGNAGWLIPRKRFDVFLRVAARVAPCIPEAVFVIAGDGPERATLERLAQELGLAPRVRWIGWQANLTDLYLSLDALLFNSDWDAMGRTPLEAVGYGVPVVASVVHGGLKEVLVTGEHIFLSPSHDIDCMAEGLLTVLNHPEKARDMALAGRQHLAKSMSVEEHVNRIEACLQLHE